MKVSEIPANILAMIDNNVISAAKIRGAGIRFTVNTCICVMQNKKEGLNGCKTFDTYDDALAAVMKWQGNVKKKYVCGDFAHARGYNQGFGWSKLVGYTRKKNGSPIFATVNISCGVDR